MTNIDSRFPKRKLRKLVHEAVGPLSELLKSVVGPPVAEVAVLVELFAWSSVAEMEYDATR